MKKAFLLVTILLISVVSTACINNFAVQELNNKAKTYLDKGDYNNAIGRLQSSLDLDPSVFETHYNLGIAFTQAEKYLDAIEAFKGAIELKPDFADTYYSLAVAQSNFAKDILSGTVTVEGKKIEDLEKAETKPSTAMFEEEEIKTYKPTESDKAFVIKLYENAADSYKTYLEKGKELKDRDNVEQEIQKLEDYILKGGEE